MVSYSLKTGMTTLSFMSVILPPAYCGHNILFAHGGGGIYNRDTLIEHRLIALFLASEIYYVFT